MKRDEHSSQGHRHNWRAIVALILLGALVSGILWSHQIWWWHIPLIVVAAHAGIVAGAVLVVWSISRKSHSHGPESVGEHFGRGLLIHKARMYDWLVKLLTFGFERKMRRWTLDLAGLKNGARILDVGCGTGTLLIEAHRYLGSSTTLHGIEPSPEMITRARSKTGKLNIKIELLQKSADALPFKDAEFDAVFCTLTLHHLPTDMQAAAVREMCRVTRPGGSLVIVDMQTSGGGKHSFLSAISPVTLFHRYSREITPSSLEHARQELEQLGVKDIAEQTYGAGLLGALVARPAKPAG